MKIILDWQKRAILLFAAIVLILSVILTVFAIREAERDKLVKQTEINQEHEIIATSVDEQIAAIIGKTEEATFKLLRSVQDMRDENQLEDVAKKIKESERMVDEIFTIDKAGRIHFPLFKPLYRLDEDSAFAPKGPSKIENDPLFESAESAEFKTRNYSLAISSYRQLFSSTSVRSSRAMLLNRMARCYKLAGNTGGALRTYNQIVRDYPNESSADGIPFALIALYQMGTVHLDNDKNSESIKAYLELYDALLEPRWAISQAQFQYQLNQVKDKLNSLRPMVNTEDMEKDIASRWSEAEQLEQRRLRRMKTIQKIAQRMQSVFTMRNADSVADSTPFFRLAETTEREPLMISYTFPDSDSMFGFSMDYVFLMKEILPSVLIGLPSREGFIVQIVDGEDAVIAGEEIPEDQSDDPPLSYSRNFADNIPPWIVKIYQTSPSEAERRFSLRRNIYILSVVVVIVAILFGGVMAIRGTAKELRLAKLKSDFVSTVSHEFRTPLTSIRYLAELLQRGRVKEESKKQQYYESITHESERLSRLIENILDFSKIEAGMKEYEFEEIDVAEICRDVASRFQEQVTPEEFMLESEIAEDLPRLFVDKEALPRALFNLLDNAVKYSGDSSNIKLRAWSDDRKIFLEVEDQGIGIKKEDQERVFDKFYRSGDIQNSTIKGSGIGLTIVSHIVEAHGGEVMLESEPGIGTKVTLQIPIDRGV